MLNYLEVFIGSILVLIASMVLGFFLGSIGSYLGFLAVSVVIGYSNGEDITNGAIYGALIGIIAGIASTIVMATFEFVLGGQMELSIMSFGYGGLLLGIMIDGIICATGSTIGSILNH